MKKYLFMLLVLSLFTAQSCEKIDRTVWIYATPCYGDAWWQGWQGGAEVEAKKSMTHYFKEKGVIILDIKTEKEFLANFDVPRVTGTAGPCETYIFCEILKED